MPTGHHRQMRSGVDLAGRESQVDPWARSGAMWLTGGTSVAPVGPPAELVPKLGAVWDAIERRAGKLGGRLASLDPVELLGERAAIAGLVPAGQSSCGGSTRLLRAREGWVAVTLARPEDVELVPAWLELCDLDLLQLVRSHAAGFAPGNDGDLGPVRDAAGAGARAGSAGGLWAAVAGPIAARPTAELVERACLLGLPVGWLRPWVEPVGEAGARPDRSARAAADPEHAASRPGSANPRLGLAGSTGRTRDPALPAQMRRLPGPPGSGDHKLRLLSDMLVVDLSALWAGPLCGSLLASAGARVVKVESPQRPDGARRGPKQFFDLLNGAKLSVSIDWRTTDGRRDLRRLLEAADVVIESSRPRALEQIGIDPVEILAAGRTQVWVSITGHGRSGPGRDRVAFGDDAAVEGGLVCWARGRPVFCADAVADPLSGMVAAAAALDALARGERMLVDVSMAQVAAHFAGPTLAVDPATRAVPPTARPVPHRAPRSGEHTAAVLAGLPA